jgi:hypothetical protein
MKNFLCKVLIPSTGKYEYFREIDFSTSKTISKYIQNNDVLGFSKCMESIIEANSQGEKRFNIIDMLAILCQLRSYSYGDTITLSGKNEKDQPVTYKHRINRILNYSGTIKECQEECFYNKNIELCVDLPYNLISDEDFDVISRNIKYLRVDHEQIDFQNIKSSDKQNILSMLDASFSGEILKYNQKIIKLLDQIKLFEDIEIKDFKNITLNPYNESVIQYLLAIFNYDLMNIYELEYILIRRLRFSLSDLQNMSINEAELHLNLYKKELQTIEEMQKKNSP